MKKYLIRILGGFLLFLSLFMRLASIFIVFIAVAYFNNGDSNSFEIVVFLSILIITILSVVYYLFKDKIQLMDELIIKRLLLYKPKTIKLKEIEKIEIDNWLKEHNELEKHFNKYKNEK